MQNPTEAPDRPAAPGKLEDLLKLRDAEIDRIEVTLADERRAGLAVRAELDQLKAAHEQLLDVQRRATWAARFKRLIGR